MTPEDGQAVVIFASSHGWVKSVDGVRWYVQRVDGSRREGVARSVAGAKSAITQIRRRWR